MRFSRSNRINRRFTAHVSPGQRPGFRNLSIAVRPEGAQGPPSALSGRKLICGLDTRGVAPGWLPPRRWREMLAV